MIRIAESCVHLDSPGDSATNEAAPMVAIRVATAKACSISNRPATSAARYPASTANSRLYRMVAAINPVLAGACGSRPDRRNHSNAVRANTRYPATTAAALRSISVAPSEENTWETGHDNPGGTGGDRLSMHRPTPTPHSKFISLIGVRAGGHDMLLNSTAEGLRELWNPLLTF